MADAPALGAGGGNPMEVQVLSSAPFVGLRASSWQATYTYGSSLP